MNEVTKAFEKLLVTEQGRLNDIVDELAACEDTAEIGHPCSDERIKWLTHKASSCRANLKAYARTAKAFEQL